MLSNIGIPAAGDVMNLVVLTAAMSSLNSGLYSTGRILRSMAMAGSAPKFTGVMSRSQVPYGGILLTSGTASSASGSTSSCPADAFEIVLNFAAIGILATWGMIMICHLLFGRKTENGELTRPAYRLPGSPWTELVTLAFLASVLVLMAFDERRPHRPAVPAPDRRGAGRGWFGVRKRIDTSVLEKITHEAAPRSVSRSTSRSST